MKRNERQRQGIAHNRMATAKRCFERHLVAKGIAHHKKLELGKNEEKIIDAFAFGIYQVLQDNGKKLFDIKEE